MLDSRESLYTPKQVSDLLDADYSDLKKLCKEHNVLPRKDNMSGRSFFRGQDVEALKRIKQLHEKSNQFVQEEKVIIPVSQKLCKPVAQDDNVRALVGNIIEAQEAIVDRLSKVIDEKLDGMDDVVVELIRTKTENEKLKQKVNELTSENYKLASEMDSYKPIAMGLYLKKPTF